MSNNKSNPLVVAFKDIIAGTIGGLGIVAVGHPFDTVKVRLQTQPAAEKMYCGMVDCFKKTFQLEGIRGLYKGVVSPLLGQMFFNALQFCAYGQAKRLVQGDKQYLTLKDIWVAGLMTGVVVSFEETPMDLFKSQMQYQIFHTKVAAGAEAKPPQFTGVIDCAMKIFKQYGLRGWYQGIGPTIIRDCLGVSLYFLSYEWYRRKMLKPGQTFDDVDRLPAIHILLAGGLGGFMYWAPIYPVDMVKSSMQTDSIHPEKRLYKSMVDCTKQLYKRGGIKVFFNGFIPCVIRSAPANAACFVCYQKTRDIIG